ncbi:hypothetical protein DT019_03305 [Streptomyces sp. SDr-06]|uniref:hypothetical protein n=1 Tax=Streptomyces sp. SDr-06 TaxID=2267702 RepID=UPI000DE884C4|nr:hypothetical protein [Streptomyces sp. SDr-06]RCH70531.1 hypothetical protein DT019_03305 [Streptomyces sp. SDr-06]
MTTDLNATDTVGLTAEGRQQLRVMLGPNQTVPKTALLFDFAQSIRDIREHQQSAPTGENLFAANLHGWMGERARWILAYLVEVDEQRERAVAHDRQPYPTADAYEQACKAMWAHKERADKAEAHVRELLAMNATLERALGIPDEPPDDDEWVTA